MGFHARNQPNADEIQTPRLDDLAANGVVLDRHYVYRFCSPSRSSFQTGRNPIHVNTGNDPLTLVNPQDPISGFAGIPRNMTVLAEKLAAAGYSTAQAGKWRVSARARLHGTLPHELHATALLACGVRAGVAVLLPCARYSPRLPPPLSLDLR